MGYCYSRGRLCCDVCGEPDGVRRQRCPHNYCQAIACCGSDACKVKLRTYRAETCAVSCKESHRVFLAREAEREALLAAGKLLRCAAVCDGHGVKVWFKSKDGEAVRWMHVETYDAFPLLDSVSVEQFEAIGVVAESLHSLPLQERQVSHV